jgi:uncharacterized protein
MEPFEDQAPMPEPVAGGVSRRSYFRDIPWRWSDVIFCFAPWAICTLALRWLPGIFSTMPNLYWVPQVLCGQIWELGFTLWIARKRCGALPALPRVRAVLRELRWLPLMVPLVFALFVVGELVHRTFHPGPPSPNEGLAPFARFASRYGQIVFAILVLTVAPIGEEVAFRGLLYNKLRQSFPRGLALVLQAAAFGAAHYLLGAAAVIEIGILALFIGLFYEWRRTLLGPVLLHAAVNTVGLAIVVAMLAADVAAPRLGVVGERGDQGCVLTDVLSGSAALHAGLKIGDVVTALDGAPVRDVAQMSEIIGRKRVGDQVVVDFTRGGKPARVEVVLTKVQEGKPGKQKGR